MDLLDAGVFPSTQAKVDQKNATSTGPEETHAAANAVREEAATPEHLHSAANCARRNTKQVEGL
jgi:hypothetical protein